ncbi:hypothetical protein BDW74DRAFT_94253 [Aspergillus multicolor]|uniref:uncharacterized protein n=1 Tax=Aspergillus multicolor TaxID=41759 RepID=UPI003CCE4BED
MKLLLCRPADAMERGTLAGNSSAVLYLSVKPRRPELQPLASSLASSVPSPNLTAVLSLGCLCLSFPAGMTGVRGKPNRLRRGWLPVRPRRVRGEKVGRCRLT